MADSIKYDEVLTSILVNEKSIVGFLSAIFNFLARRTDFYYVPEGPYENMGFPPGVAEELVIKVLRKCDPKSWYAPEDDVKATDMNEIMCSTVAQEVEVVSEEVSAEEVIKTTTREDVDNAAQNLSELKVNPEPSHSTANITDTKEIPKEKVDDDDAIQEATPIIPTQRNSETYNGAEREKYSWSQTIMDLEVTAKLQPDIKTSKDLKVTINSGDICVTCRNGEVLLKDKFPYKIKTADSFWSISEGKLLIHLEKLQERWWNKLLEGEEAIDLSKIDCSRPLYELPDDHIAKVHELQWNQDQKMKGLPTSDELRNMEILKKAWNMEGSPFKGKQFDPNVVLHK